MMGGQSAKIKNPQRVDKWWRTEIRGFADLPENMKVVIATG